VNANRERNEPGNALGALGLILAAAGGARLSFAIPPSALALPRGAAWCLVAVGAVLLVAGLRKEYSGPRRWSALVPGLLALLVGAGFGLRSAQLQGARPATRTAEIESGSDLKVWVPRTGDPTSCALVVGGGLDVADAVAEALALEGVAAAAVPTWRPARLPQARVALSQLASGPCALVIDAQGGNAQPVLAAAPTFDRRVVLSAPAAEGFEAGSAPVPTLYLFGAADSWGHAQASALIQQLDGASGEPSVVRVFLGADRDFLVPRQHHWRQPGVLAEGYVRMMARWIQEGTA